MELCNSLHSPLLSSSLSPLPLPLPSHRGITVTGKPHGSRKVPTLKRHLQESKLKGCSFRAQASSVVSNSGSVLVEDTSKKANLKDKNLVFVAGATGKVGSRTVRELLKLGFRVRAGVRSTQKAKSLVQSVEQMKLDFEDGSKAVEKLDIVECDLEKKDGIEKALGNASVVICSIGASEKEVFDITGPYRIDFQATNNLVDAATVAEVDHFILVTSLGTNKFGFPAAILNLFWGVLCWKRKAEEALVASGLPYTIVRPGGMERPTDAYKETHNITLSQEDTLFGGQVSNLQVAELMAVMARNPELSYCKVVEVIAETTALLTPMEELLAKIPSKRPLPKSYQVPDNASKVDPALSEGDVSEVPSKGDPALSEGDVSKTQSFPGQKEAVQEKSTLAKPLSPYVVYDDLKPPVSPTPTPPSSQKRTEIVNAAPTLETPTNEKSLITQEPEVQKQRTQPLSPYVAYEDLKPPTSPSPTPRGSKAAISSGTTSIEFLSPSDGGNDVVDAGVDGKDLPQKFTYYQSPYAAYDDLKPPTSPSPNAPNGSVTPSSPNGGIKTTIIDTFQLTTEDKFAENQNQPTVRPLSPYAMYEDLKPPSSPSPSPRFPENTF